MVGRRVVRIFRVPRHVRRFLSLRCDEQEVLIRAFVGLMRTDLEFRLLGFRRTLSRVENREPGLYSRVTIEELNRSLREAQALELACRYHFIPVRCLHRSVTLHRWIRERGAPSQLRIGVVKVNGQLKAHAWVELQGHPLGDSPESLAEFKVLQSPWSTQHSGRRGYTELQDSALRTLNLL